jgi:hypothetical protein
MEHSQLALGFLFEILKYSEVCRKVAPLFINRQPLEIVFKSYHGPAAQGLPVVSLK